ncbi:translocation/assembly module TamB domain-containing protein [Agrilutibacter solisilvae]|uniref:Dicarboxylate transport domain-containing protein n=1 Tax=Agrilutibacter solisilvae TaxID=2763317 RepID=A0A975ASF0_9GAMM|nr:hypothetical protein [Lysobacter solisilvae]QSX78233.1 hypothetical protein I8J32_016380 [Lysobacter solisilvae]
MRAMVRLTAVCLLLALAGGAHARAMTARIGRVITPVATLEGVRVQLDWPAQAAQGQLRLQARRVAAADLGYRFTDLDWRCPLHRDGQGGWRCDGAIRQGRGAPAMLHLALGPATTDVELRRGGARLGVHRSAATPDITDIDLTHVPLVWTQALLAQAWPAGNLKAGTLDGRMQVIAAANAPLRVTGPLTLAGGALDTADGLTAAENLAASLNLDLSFAERDRVRVDGFLRGGELLFGNAYIALGQRRVALQLDAVQAGNEWQVPTLSWRDPGILTAQGTATLGPDASLRTLDLRLETPDLAPLRDAYLTGLLGVAGVSDIALRGAADAGLHVRDGALTDFDVVLRAVDIDDPQQRFGFHQLEGDVRLSSSGTATSELQWQSGQLYGLNFGAARIPLDSSGGELRSRAPIVLPMLGGQIRFDQLRLRPPSAGQGLDVRFGMSLEQLDVAQLAKALQWPAFTGQLTGSIPQAHYVNETLVFDGGLSMQIFDGSVSVSSLAMERPFGVAPTLSADVELDDLDMESLTGVFGFGSVSGRLDGRIGALRMVDWQAVAFDASLRTDRAAARAKGTRQRISQRAVQDLSSVGDASVVTSLQSRLIGFFDDFGYRRIGIDCHLADDVCAMDGLGSAGQGFIIVEGSGLPRLTVVGFNRQVDWPTLVERLGAIGQGEVKPVVQ